MIQAQGLTSASSILDYGCGAGLFVDFLREQGVENANRLWIRYLPNHADPQTLARQYDAVGFSYDVIEHSEEPREFFFLVAGPPGKSPEGY